MIHEIFHILLCLVLWENPQESHIVVFWEKKSTMNDFISYKPTILTISIKSNAFNGTFLWF